MEGVSSLGWLLDQYLEQRESSQNPLSRAASFGSRVRRLCHLLVHVEPPPGPSPEPSTQPSKSQQRPVELRTWAVMVPGFSPSWILLSLTAPLWAFPGVSTQDLWIHSGAETKPLPLPSVSAVSKNSKSRDRSPGPSAALPSSSLRNITQCWLTVVQEQVSAGRLQVGGRGAASLLHLMFLLLPSQVSRFLAAAWRAPDFVPRYCKLYERLQRAGSELFGPRAAFTLALRSGFSGALLQQSFLTAAHVSTTSLPVTWYKLTSFSASHLLSPHTLLLPLPLHAWPVPFPLPPDK